MPETALDPTIIVIFGITGDLSQRYLLPALYHLMKDNLLHPETVIVGISRRSVTVEELLDNVELCVNETDKVCDPVALKKVQASLRMHQMGLVEPEDYDTLLTYLNQIEEEKGMCMNRLYYLSIPPQVFGPIVRLLGEHGLNTSCQHGNAHTRLLVEKPFGYDLASARELIAETSHSFSEEQIFRIDHYLAKETAQNILAFRLRNPLFAAAWKANHISEVEITASEKIGIEGRATFYEQTGALRDFVQSHLLQLLAIVAMEPPAEMTSQAIHAAKLTLLNSVPPIQPNEVGERAIRGQYEGYRDEVGNPNSTIETYAELHLTVDNERWGGVPFTIRTGKALTDKRTYVRVQFSDQAGNHNELNLRIQPNEGIDIELSAKKPGFDKQLQPVHMDFRYQDNFDNHGHPDAYERVLVDAVRGDSTLFASSEEVLASWRIVENVVQAWGRDGEGLKFYKPGSSAKL